MYGVSEILSISPPFIAALDRSTVVLAYVQQVLFLAIDHFSEVYNLESLFFTLELHLVEHPCHLRYIVPQAISDCAAMYVLQMRFPQEPIKDTAVLTVFT